MEIIHTCCHSTAIVHPPSVVQSSLTRPVDHTQLHPQCLASLRQTDTKNINLIPGPIKITDQGPVRWLAEPFFTHHQFPVKTTHTTLATYNAITKDKYETYTSAMQLYQMCTQHTSKDDYQTESLHLKSTTLDQQKQDLTTDQPIPSYKSVAQGTPLSRRSNAISPCHHHLSFPCLLERQYPTPVAMHTPYCT